MKSFSGSKAKAFAGEVFQVALMRLEEASSRAASPGGASPGGALPDGVLAHASVDTLVAVKRPLERDGDQGYARAALVREAKFLALATSTAVPRLLHVGNDERGPFVVEEAIEGTSFEALLERRPSPLPFHLAAHLVSSAAEALEALHAATDEQGSLALVHGDPSPQNLLMTPLGFVRLVDFGASSFRGAAPLEPRFTGTLPYAAPELVRGEVEPSRETDVYALAAVAARLLSDRPLADGLDEAERLVAIAERGLELDHLAHGNGPVEDALRHLLAFDPLARARDFGALVRALASRHDAPD